MGITLNNTAASGTVNITLDKVVAYAETHANNFPTKAIPGKTSPTIDTDSFTKNPTMYNITAIVSDTDKATLQTLANEEDKQCKLTDNEQSNKNVRPINISFTANPGDTDLPWQARIQMQAEDH